MLDAVEADSKRLKLSELERDLRKSGELVVVEKEVLQVDEVLYVGWQATDAVVAQVEHLERRAVC